jgi:hypothetical protein
MQPTVDFVELLKRAVIFAADAAARPGGCDVTYLLYADNDRGIDTAAGYNASPWLVYELGELYCARNAAASEYYYSRLPAQQKRGHPCNSQAVHAALESYHGWAVPPMPRSRLEAAEADVQPRWRPLVFCPPPLPAGVAPLDEVHAPPELESRDAFFARIRGPATPGALLEPSYIPLVLGKGNNFFT